MVTALVMGSTSCHLLCLARVPSRRLNSLALGRQTYVAKGTSVVLVEKNKEKSNRKDKEKKRKETK